MNRSIKNWITDNYKIDEPENCSEEDVLKIKEINCSRKGIESIDDLKNFFNIEKINISDNEITDLELSAFPKLKELNCSYCSISKIDISKNSLLEKIQFEGMRGKKLKNIDLSQCTRLKKIVCGQDGLINLDLTRNIEVEEIEINLSQDLRLVEVRNCSNLKTIRLWGVLIPYIDLTQNKKLEYVEINYLNTFRGKEDEYGEGYPRPFIFVSEDFEKSIINSQDLENSYFTHILVRVSKGSKAERVLNELNSDKDSVLSITNVAYFHYKIKEKLDL